MYHLFLNTLDNSTVIVTEKLKQQFIDGMIILNIEIKLLKSSSLKDIENYQKTNN